MTQKYYNHEFKEQFIESLGEDSSFRAIYRAMFTKSASVEERLNKDIYDFNTNDIELFFYTVSTPAIKTLGAYLSSLVRYTNYAIEQGVRTGNINIYKNIATNSLQGYVAEYKYQFFTLEEFNETMKHVFNASDVAIYRALFEGIGGRQYSELMNLKASEVYEEDGHWYVDLHEETNDGSMMERTIEISYELYKDLMRAYRQETYISKNGEGGSVNSETEVVESPYVFRPLKKGAYHQSDGQINKQTIYRKKILLDKLTDGSVSNVNAIATSGMLHQAYTIYKEQGYLDSKDLLSIGERFKTGSTAQHVSQRIKRMKDILASGLKELYNIELNF